MFFFKFRSSFDPIKNELLFLKTVTDTFARLVMKNELDKVCFTSLNKKACNSVFLAEE